MTKAAKIAAVFAIVLCPALAYGSMQDKLARFSTPGPDRYADGSIVRDGECCSLKELAVGGRDLIAEGMTPGPAMGEILGKLLDRVLEDPSLNDRDTLLSIAKEYI